MATRIGDFVLHGELINQKNYSTHGMLELRGSDRPLLFELTGDCAPDLKGRHIRFTARPTADSAIAGKPPRIVWQQVGPTGHISAAAWTRAFDCTVQEFVNRACAGEAPPTTWRRYFYMEWFSQNGRMVVELVDPEIEFLDGEVWRPLPHLTPRPDRDPDARPEPGTGPEIIAVTDTGESWRVQGGPDEPAPERETRSREARDLQAQLDAEADAVERAIRGEAGVEAGVEAGGDDADDDADLREMELMDDLIENDPGDPIITLLQTPRRLPPPEELSDEQADTTLKCLLAELAMFGIAFHLCEHCTPREGYRLLIERVIHERAFAPLRGTGWVQVFMASDFCPLCLAEDDEQANQ